MALGASSVAITWFAMGARDTGRPAAGQEVGALDALDRVHARNGADGAHHVVELLHVDDLDLEGRDGALLAVRARIRLQDVHAHVGERLAHASEQALAIVGADAEVDGALELAMHVPGDVDPPLGIGLQPLLAGARMHGDAAAARDEADDLVSRYRVAALGVADQHVVDAADAHAAAGAVALGDAAEQLGQPAGMAVGGTVAVLLRLLLGELLGRQEPLQDARGRELAVPDRAHQIFGARVSVLVGDLLEVGGLHHLGEGEVEAAELALQQIASDLQRSLALLLLDEAADLRLRPAGLHEREPVLVGPDVLAREDLHRIAVLQLVAQRHDLAVDLRPLAVGAHLGVDGVGEVDRTAALGKAADVALGREAEHLVGEEIDLHRLEELARVLEVLLPLHELPQPGELLLVLGALAFLVGPVRGDALLRNLVHLLGAHLDLDAFSAGADHRGVQRLVHVRLRDRYVVLESSRHRLPEGMDEAERLVACGDRL